MAVNDPLRTALKDLKLTSEEVSKFENAFRDKEFIKLFADYAREISDPKVQEETDQYLRQLEAEGQAEEVYGKGVQLVSPKAQFVVKLKSTTNKIFINVCSSEKVDKPTTSSATENDRKGLQFQIPLMLGSKKVGEDSRKQPCDIWDFVVHPDAIRMSRSNLGFRDLLVHTAIEKIEEVHILKLGRNYSVLKQEYKGVNGHTKPQVLAVRAGSGGEVQGGRLRPNPAAALKPASDARDQQANKQAPSEPAKSSRTAFTPKFAATNSAAHTLEPHKSGYKHASGEITPSWAIVHRGELDLLTAWGDVGRTIPISLTCPKELLVKIELPGVKSVKAVELDVDKQSVSLQCPGQYKLQLSLPYQVIDSKGQAKFDVATQRLELLLPVKPPPMPEMPVAAERSTASQNIVQPSSVPEQVSENPEPTVSTVHKSSSSDDNLLIIDSSIDSSSQSSHLKRQCVSQPGNLPDCNLLQKHAMHHRPSTCALFVNTDADLCLITPPGTLHDVNPAESFPRTTEHDAPSVLNQLPARDESNNTATSDKDKSKQNLRHAEMGDGLGTGSESPLPIIRAPGVWGKESETSMAKSGAARPISACVANSNSTCHDDGTQKVTSHCNATARSNDNEPSHFHGSQQLQALQSNQLLSISSQMIVRTPNEERWKQLHKNTSNTHGGATIKACGTEIVDSGGERQTTVGAQPHGSEITHADSDPTANVINGPGMWQTTRGKCGSNSVALCNTKKTGVHLKPLLLTANLADDID